MGIMGIVESSKSTNNASAEVSLGKFAGCADMIMTQFSYQTPPNLSKRQRRILSQAFIVIRLMS